MMTLKEKIEFWVDSSSYDMDSARAMQESGRYVYTVFMCQQTIEKFLKAIHLDIHKIEAPKSHNLNYLADITKLNLSEENKRLMAELSGFYISGRYPDYKMKISSLIKREKGDLYLKQTEGMIQWLKQYLTN